MRDRPRLVYFTSGLWPCGVASYQRNLAAALAAHADVETIRLPTDRVFGDDLSAVLRQRRRYQQLARRSARCDAVLLDYTATFWNGSRLGENFFPAFARYLRAPAVVILHEDAGRTDPADTSGPFAVRAAKRLAHLALAAWDTRSRQYDAFVRGHLFDFAAHVVAHAEALAAVVPGRVHVLPTPAYPLPAPTAPLQPGTSRLAVLFGFPQPSKGFDRAVNALPHMPPDVTLLVVGWSERSKAEFGRLGHLAMQHDALHRFAQVGDLSDGELADTLASAAVAIAPFRAVHQSSSLGHLIAAGVPIVAHLVPTTERLAADGAGVRLVDCDNPVSLAAAVSEVLADGAELRRSNADYARRHSFDAVARFVLGLLGVRP